MMKRNFCTNVIKYALLFVFHDLRQKCRESYLAVYIRILSANILNWTGFTEILVIKMVHHISAFVIYLLFIYYILVPFILCSV